MTRIEFLAHNVSLAVGIEVYLDLTIKGEIMVDHEGKPSDNVKKYFSIVKMLDCEYDEECNRTFYTFDTDSYKKKSK